MPLIVVVVENSKPNFVKITSSKMGHHLMYLCAVDDPVNVIAVHFGGGLWGTVGGSLLRADSLFGGFGHQAGVYLGYQIVGAIAIMAWAFSCAFTIFFTLRMLGLLRSTPEDELAGIYNII